MGSALLNPASGLEFAESEKTVAPALRPRSSRGERFDHAAAVPGTVEELRAQVAERLAAHRSRRGAVKTQADAPDGAQPAATRSARIAATVAERYAQTPSYRAVLAAEAERATQRARAAAEVAALNADAVAAAQQRLLAAYDEHASRANEADGSAAVALHLWPEPESVDDPEEKQFVHSAPEAVKLADRSVKRGLAMESSDSAPAVRMSQSPEGGAGGLTVRLYDDAARAVRRSVPAAAETFTSVPIRPRGVFAESSAAEAMALDDEIAFRHAPVFEEPAGPPLALPANLIEFPRQLVAARKARPRYAEGPLREDADTAPGDGQLRIFEVDAAQISTAPEETSSVSPQWTSIWLDGPAEAVSARSEVAANEPLELAVAVLEPASLKRRGMAGAINFAIVAAGMTAFAATVAAMFGHEAGVSWHTGLPMVASVREIAAAIAAATDLQAKSAGLVAAASCVVLLLVYHALFFCFSTATPGMRWVRIAFCTFEDGNPTRRAVRRRMLGTLLSACPLGMGYAWAALDEERLTWHDRMSRMYLRRY
jgi:hypothetical protein